MKHIVKHGLDWICKTRTGFVKHGFVKHGFVKHGFVKRGFVKRGFVKHGFVKHGFVKGGFVKRGFVKRGFVKHGFVKGGLSFFVKNDCLTVYLFISVCPFLILILLLFVFYNMPFGEAVDFTDRLSFFSCDLFTHFLIFTSRFFEEIMSV